MKMRVVACFLIALLCVGFGGGPLTVAVSADTVHSGYNYVGVVKVTAGKTIDLKPYVGQYDSEEERYTMGATTWKSLITDVATIDKNGIATGVKPGSSRITAISMNNAGETIEQVILLRVQQADGPITVNKKKHDVTLAMYIHQNMNLSQLVPADDATWSVLDKSVASVKKSGAVTAEGVGKTVITATYKDKQGNEQSMSIQLQVRGDNDFNNDRNDTITLYKGDSIDLLEMFYPNLTTVSQSHLNEFLKVSVSDMKVISADGYTITAKKAGTCKVTLEYDEFSSIGYRGNEIITIRVLDT